VSDVGHIVWKELVAEEALRGTEVPQLQEEAELICGSSQGGEQLAQGIRDNEALLPLHNTQYGWGIECLLFSLGENPLARHGWQRVT
jgi:hypothetical protein